jgi:hypothetical protein
VSSAALADPLRRLQRLVERQQRRIGELEKLIEELRRRGR